MNNEVPHTFSDTGALPGNQRSAVAPLRHHPISADYRRLFGCKVYKVAVAVARTCPNRAGLNGMRVCTFCDPWGSAAHEEGAGLTLTGQIRINAERIRARYKAEKFIVYFQAYTNTFQPLARLERQLHEALAVPDVVGVALGTRPDCLPGPMIELLAGLAERTHVSVELGLQTLDDGQLAFLARGHDSACSLEALERLKRHPRLNLCAHLMFGLPGETEAQLRDTARTLSRLGVHGVKLHNLHVLRNTPLEALYREGRFTPVTLEAYARKVRVFLEYLDPAVAVHRLAAVASRWDEVVAPPWARGKLRPAQAVLDELERAGSRQGLHAQPAAGSAAWA